jgi:hypothetical protein
MKLKDVPVATAMTIFFAILGGTLFSTIGQTVQLNSLLPEIRVLNPSLNSSDIVKAGATGLRNLVLESQYPELLRDYAKSIDTAFIVAIAAAATATFLALGIEWKNMKKKSTIKKAQPVESTVF